MNSSRFARLTFAVLGVAALTLGVSTAPASAAVVDRDPVRVALANVDFGAGALVAGTPGFGKLVWDITGALTTPTAIGTLYTTPGTCARVRLESYDAFFTLINSRTGPVFCGIAGGANQWAVNLSNAGDPLTIHALVVVQTLTAAGVWTTAGSAAATLF
jgi:hypothetical protein